MSKEYSFKYKFRHNAKHSDYVLLHPHRPLAFLLNYKQHKCQIYDINTRKLVQEILLSSPFGGMILHENQQWIVISAIGAIVIHDIDTGELIQKIIIKSGALLSYLLSIKVKFKT